MIRIIESSLLIRLQKKYIKYFCETRKEHYPIQYTFLVTKIKFQDYIIKKMVETPSLNLELLQAYEKIKVDKSLQEKAIKAYEGDTKRVQFNHLS